MTRLRHPITLALVLACATAAPAEDGPLEVARRLTFDDFRIRADVGAGSGVTGARKLLLVFDDGRELTVKWKAAPESRMDAWNNAPRKELGAYAVQRWFLDPDDDVVPPTVGRCIPVETLQALEERARPTVEGTHCVLGVLALWLQHVAAPEEIYDDVRFRAQPAYARHMADLNLLTYLIKHQDGRPGNFLASTDVASGRVYAVDNGIAFGTLLPNFLVRNWDAIRVPALRKQSVDRLRKIGRADLDRLGVLVEMRSEKGILRTVSPGPNMDPSSGARIGAHSIQVGLTAHEIDLVERRLRRLLADVDAGEIPLFD